MVLEKEVERILGHPDLLKEIANIIMTATIDEVLNHALYCLLTLLSSYSHGRAVAEVTAYRSLRVCMYVYIYIYVFSTYVYLCASMYVSVCM